MKSVSARAPKPSALASSAAKVGALVRASSRAGISLLSASLCASTFVLYAAMAASIASWSKATGLPVDTMWDTVPNRLLPAYSASFSADPVCRSGCAFSIASSKIPLTLSRTSFAASAKPSSAALIPAPVSVSTARIGCVAV